MTLRIRHKVLLPALAVIVVLLALAGYSFYSIWQINSLAEDLKRDHLPGTTTARDMGLLLDTLVRLKKIAAVTTKPADAAEYTEGFRRTREELDRKLESLAQEPVHRRLKLALSNLYGALETYTQETKDIPEVSESVETAEKEGRERLSDLDEHYAKKVQRSVETVAEIGRVAARSTLYALLAGLVVSVVVWILILLSLSRPLRELVAGTERVAQGWFGEPIPVLSQDELGTLSAAFNRMAASLSELDRLKADFVATASHELKTPLTCIKGLASLLRSGLRGPLTEEQRATLVQVEEEVDQVTSFVSQLLDLSRLRAGRVTMNTRSL
ncbi:MAG: histidine kinase dimerization/phospho-acceptor domain-containing protein, partial [bacterium]